MLGLSQSFCCYISCFLSSIFLVFGIHGGNVMAPIMEGVFGVALLVNLEAYQNNETILMFGQVYHTDRLSGMQL